MKHSVFSKNFSTCAHRFFKKTCPPTREQPILRPNEELAKSYCETQTVKKTRGKPVKFVPDRDDPDCVWCNRTMGFCEKFFRK